MAEIITMRGITCPESTVDRQPVVNIIVILEKLLAEARSGELRSLGVACVRLGEATGTAWERPSDGSGGHQLMAAITYLYQRYASSMIGR